MEVAALRSPDNGRWYAFPPRALIFGEVSDVLRYNFFSRIITCQANRIFGIRYAGYLDEYGAMRPSKPPRHGLDTFCGFGAKPAVLLTMCEILVDKALATLGMFGECRNLDNARLLRHPLPDEKETRWGEFIKCTHRIWRSNTIRSW